MGVARRCAALATAAITGVLAGCSASPDASARSVVDWYVAPGPVDTTALARSCSGSGVNVRVHRLPADADERHTFLVRTLQADPGAIDLLSLDAASVPELAAAGFLQPSTTDTTGVLPAAVEATTYDGDQVATPWMVDPQLLWFRTVAAERAGLDPAAPITWDDLIAGADRLGVTVQVADTDGTGVVSWLSGLVASGAGTLVDGPGSDATVGLDTNAARGAASVMEFYRESQVGPGASADAVSDFLGGSGGFLVAPASVFSDPALRQVVSQIGVAPYPVIVADRSVSPGSTLALAVPEGPSTDAADDVVDCLTEPTTVREVMVSTGLASVRPTDLEDPTLAAELPTATQLSAALTRLASPPVTPYWNAIRRAVDETWAPLAGVTTDATPVESQTVVTDALRGRVS